MRIRKNATSMSMAFLMTFAPILPVAAQQPAEPEAASTEALVAHTGGVVRGKRARTQTTHSDIGSPGSWIALPSGALQWTVPAGTTQLFNVAFSAECGKLLGGRAHIRIRVTNQFGFNSFLQPYDGGQVFCEATEFLVTRYNTHKGNWAARLPAGTYTLRVEFNNSQGGVRIDDWTFELVVYA